MRALYEQKFKAVRMRKEGASYNQIKEKISVSKSTLSLWLRNMPLSEKRLRELRDFNAIRIEKYRETRRKTREARWSLVKEAAKKEIGQLSKRELLIAGLFLYWGEGSKTDPYLICASNTDPAMMSFFVKWMELIGIGRGKLRVKIHLYRDMDIKRELRYWSETLGIPLSNFRKPYIKDSERAGLSYPQRFVHGTANIMYGNRDISEKVLMSVEYLRLLFANNVSV